MSLSSGEEDDGNLSENQSEGSSASGDESPPQPLSQNYFAPLQKLEKKIPNQPSNVTPVQLRPKQIFSDVRIGPGDGKPFIAGQEAEAAKQ